MKRISLLETQVIEWELPPAPAKTTDSRTAKWNGLGQVELDAVEPDKLQELCFNSLNTIFDKSAFHDLMEKQKTEKIKYKNELRLFVSEELNNE